VFADRAQDVLNFHPGVNDKFAVFAVGERLDLERIGLFFDHRTGIQIRVMTRFMP
jgi:hypothetical protein